MGKSISEFFGVIADTFQYITIWDIIDILLVAVFIYTVIKLIRDTRAAQLARGIILIIILLQITKLFNLGASEYILNSCLEFGVLAVLIVFQPELRSALEKVGRRSVNTITLIGGADDEVKREYRINEMINDITKAVGRLSATKTGALIIIERGTKLGDIINTGVSLDASPTPELITNIFFNKAPLHDGAMIIRNNRIAACGCWLPLSQKTIDQDLGTRHRAGLGMSEISDAIVIIVSEETGIISMAVEGRLNRRFSPDALTANLKKLLLPKEEKKKDFFAGLWKGRSEK